MADTNNNMTNSESEAATPAYPDISGIPTTPVAPPGGYPVPDGYPDISGIPTTPVAPPGGYPVPDGYPDISGIPTTPVAPPGGYPVPDGPSAVVPGGPGPVIPDYYWPVYPTPSVTYYSQVRFLNASTDRTLIDVFIDNQRVLSGSDFATVSPYLRVTDGFHTVTVRQTSGQMRVLYQQTQAFISGEKMTMVILDSPAGVTLARVSDMGCTNVPRGYGCCRVANMSYNGSNYDVKLYNNQTVFAGIGYKEVTTYKQTAAGNYTFFVTNSGVSVSAIRELPVIIVSALLNNGCSSCAVSNPVLTYSLNIEAGKAYTSYIIGNPWSNPYRVFTLAD